MFPPGIRITSNWIIINSYKLLIKLIEGKRWGGRVEVTLCLFKEFSNFFSFNLKKEFLSFFFFFDFFPLTFIGTSFLCKQPLNKLLNNFKKLIKFC